MCCVYRVSMSAVPQVEGQRAEQAQARQESAVLAKVDNIRLDQTKRAEALAREANQEELKVALPPGKLATFSCFRGSGLGAIDWSKTLSQQLPTAAQATLIEYNLEAVDGAIAAVRGALASGLSWKELKRLIKSEREAGNPVAALVHSLELEQNRIILLLSNFLDDEEGDDDAITRPATKVVAQKACDDVRLGNLAINPDRPLKSCCCLAGRDRLGPERLRQCTEAL